MNSWEGYTIAASEAKFLDRIAKRTVLSDGALSVLIPILEDIFNLIRHRFESCSNRMVSRFKNGTNLA